MHDRKINKIITVLYHQMEKVVLHKLSDITLLCCNNNNRTLYVQFLIQN